MTFQGSAASVVTRCMTKDVNANNGLLPLSFVAPFLACFVSSSAPYLKRAYLHPHPQAPSSLFRFKNPCKDEI